jgi:hypothetical protein
MASDNHWPIICGDIAMQLRKDMIPRFIANSTTRNDMLHDNLGDSFSALDTLIVAGPSGSQINQSGNNDSLNELNVLVGFTIHLWSS